MDNVGSATSESALTSLLDRTSEIASSAGRADLVDRLAVVRRRVVDPRFRVVVVGQLKQGKSQFVNSLLNLSVCSVGDDETTAVPTVVQHAEQASAELVLAEPGGETRRVEVPLAELDSVTPSTPLAQGREVLRLEVGVPSPLLADGLVFVDTRGWAVTETRTRQPLWVCCRGPTRYSCSPTPARSSPNRSWRSSDR